MAPRAPALAGAARKPELDLSRGRPQGLGDRDHVPTRAGRRHDAGGTCGLRPRVLRRRWRDSSEPDGSVLHPVGTEGPFRPRSGSERSRVARHPLRTGPQSKREGGSGLLEVLRSRAIARELHHTSQLLASEEANAPRPSGRDQDEDIVHAPWRHGEPREQGSRTGRCGWITSFLRSHWHPKPGNNDGIFGRLQVDTGCPSGLRFRWATRCSALRVRALGHLENSIASASIYKGQVKKGSRWMPWRQEPMKDASGCEKLRGAV